MQPASKYSSNYTQYPSNNSKNNTNDERERSIKRTYNDRVVDRPVHEPKKNLSERMDTKEQSNTDELALKRRRDEDEKVAESTKKVKHTHETNDLPHVYRKDEIKINRPAPKVFTHSVTLKQQYIRQIKNGSKTVEGRINSGMFLKFRAGDEVRFFCNTDEVTCRVTKITSYNSFRDMLEATGVENCLADVRSLEEGVRIYDNIPGYAAKARQFGVLAIHIERKNRQ